MLDRLDALRWRQHRERERDAWMLAHLLTPHSNQPLRPADFLPGGGTVPDADKAGFVEDRLRQWEEAHRAESR